MNFSGDKSRLLGVTKEFKLQWERTKDMWRDTKSAEFEHRYVGELIAHVNRTILVVERLDELLKKMQHDCE
jgi:hypothetical protein